MIDWKSWEQSLRSGVQSNDALRERLEQRVRSHRRHSSMWRYLITVPVAFAVVAMVVWQVPNGTEAGFITRALATFEEQQNVLTAEQVRHILITNGDGVQEFGSHETWQRGDGTVLIRSSGEDVTLIRDGVVYMTVASIAEVTHRQAEQNVYEREDIAREPFRVEIAPTALGMSGGGDGKYFCANVSYPSSMPASQEFDITYRRILDALGLTEEPALPNTHKALAILVDANGVTDMGVITDPEFGDVHRIRMSTPTRRQGTGDDGVDFDFLADPTATRIVRIREWSFNPDVVNEATSVTEYSIDEVLTAEDVGESFFDPATYGLVASPDFDPVEIIDTRPVFTVTASGCYMYDAETQSFSVVPPSDYDKIPNRLANMLE